MDSDRRLLPTPAQSDVCFIRPNPSFTPAIFTLEVVLTVPGSVVGLLCTAWHLYAQREPSFGLVDGHEGPLLV